MKGPRRTRVPVVHSVSGLLCDSGFEHDGRFLLTISKSLRFLAVYIHALEFLTVRVEQRRHPVVVLAAPILWKYRGLSFSGHES